MAKWISCNGNGKEYEVSLPSLLPKYDYNCTIGEKIDNDMTVKRTWEALLRGEILRLERDDNNTSDCRVKVSVQLQYLDFADKFGLCEYGWPAWIDNPMYPDRRNDGTKKSKPVKVSEKEQSSESEQTEKISEQNRQELKEIQDKISDKNKDAILKESLAEIFGISDNEFQTMIDGIKVKSREEVIIVDRLVHWLDDTESIEYEPEHIGIFLPDFRVYEKSEGKRYYWEHLGGWSIEGYREWNLKKLQFYFDEFKNDPDKLPRLTFPLSALAEYKELQQYCFLDVTRTKEALIDFLKKDPSELYKYLGIK